MAWLDDAEGRRKGMRGEADGQEDVERWRMVSVNVEQCHRVVEAKRLGTHPHSDGAELF